MKKIYLFFLCSLIFGIYARGQVAVYTFAQSTGTYTPITGGTQVAVATASVSLDDVVYPITIPSFTYNGTAYTSLFISTNGFVSFGTTPSNTIDQAISNLTGGPVICPWARDVSGIFNITGRTSEIRWEQIGSEVIIQWQDFRPAFSTSTTNVYVQSYQVRLNTSNNSVSVVYSGGAFLVGSTAITGASTTAAPQVGLRGATTADFNNRTNTNAINFTASTAGTVNSANQFFNTNATPPGMPSAGLTYTWTPPSCVAPGSLVSSALTPTSATISWANSPSAVGGYEWEIRISGACGSGTPLQTGTTGAGVTTTNLVGLTANTTYTYCVRSICAGPSNSGWISGTFFTGYCIPAPSSVDGTGITNVTAGVVNNTTVAEPGNYGNYTSLIFDAQQGVATPVRITFTTGFTYETKIWVDLNNDLDFFDAGEELYSGTSLAASPTTLVASINIPLVTPLGQYRLRIGSVDEGPPTPCYTGTFGSYEDYTVNVTAAPSCLAPSGLMNTAITNMSATHSWSAVAGALGYEWFVSTSATPPASGTATTNLTENSTGLTAPTVYYLHVRTDCGAGSFSAWSTLTFTTVLPPPANDLCSGAIAIPCNGSVSGDNTTATNDALPGVTCGSTTSDVGNNKGVWHTIMPTTSGSVTISTCTGTAWDTYLRVYTGACGTFTACAGFDDDGCSSSSQSSVTFIATAGVTYYVLLGGFDNADFGDYTISTTCPSPMTYVSSTTTQPIITTVGAGSTNQGIVRLEVTVIGNASPLSISQIDFNTNGTTNLADITNARVYYTGTSGTLTTTTQFGTVVVGPSGSFSVTGTAQVLTGTSTNTVNNFWLVYDIACAATPVNVVDAECTGFNIGTSQVPTVTAPAGDRAITSSTSFTTVANGEWNNPATWACGAIPLTSSSSVTIANAITVSNSGNVGGNVTINAGASLTMNAGGDLTLGTVGGGNSVLSNSGTLAVTGGTLNQNGSILSTLGSSVNQSGGNINIDGNAGGVIANSVASGTAILQLNQLNTGINLTGGTLTIVDPHAAASGNVFTYDNVSSVVASASTNHTFVFGDGVSTDAGGNTNGFIVDPWINNSFFTFGNVIVNGSTGTNRVLTCAYQLTAIGDIIINANSTLNAARTIFIGKNLTVNTSGTLINIQGISTGLITSTDGFTIFSSPVTNAQSITNNGVIANLATTPTANLASLTVNNTSTAGLTLNSQLSISGALSMTAGRINTTATNMLTLGFNATNAGTLTYSAGQIVGPFTRWITAATGSRQFPMGNGTSVKNANINFTTAPTTAGTLTAEWKNTPPVTPQPALTEGALIVNKASDQGSWLIDATTLDGGVYTGTFTANGSTDVVDFARTVLIKRPSSGGAWVLDGTHVTSTGSNTAPVLSRTGMVGFSEFAIGGEANIVLPLNLIYFTGVKQADGNKLDWKVTCIGSPSVVLTIERSGDGRRFSPIYNLSATALRCETPFDFKDLNPSTGVNYYRLKMVDIDGRVSYSPIVVIINKGAGIEIVNVYPNPVRDAATLSIASAKQANVEVRVSDLSGRTVLTRKVSLTSGTNKIPLNLANLSSGTYLVTVAAEGEVLKTTKIIKD